LFAQAALVSHSENEVMKSQKYTHIAIRKLLLFHSWAKSPLFEARHEISDTLRTLIKQVLFRHDDGKARPDTWSLQQLLWAAKYAFTGSFEDPQRAMAIQTLDSYSSKTLDQFPRVGKEVEVGLIGRVLDTFAVLKTMPSQDLWSCILNSAKQLDLPAETTAEWLNKCATFAGELSKCDDLHPGNCLARLLLSRMELLQSAERNAGPPLLDSDVTLWLSAASQLGSPVPERTLLEMEQRFSCLSSESNFEALHGALLRFVDHGCPPSPELLRVFDVLLEERATAVLSKDAPSAAVEYHSQSVGKLLSAAAKLEHDLPPVYLQAVLKLVYGSVEKSSLKKYYNIGGLADVLPACVKQGHNFPDSVVDHVCVQLKNPDKLGNLAYAYKTTGRPLPPSLTKAIGRCFHNPASMEPMNSFMLVSLATSAADEDLPLGLAIDIARVLEERFVALSDARKRQVCMVLIKLGDNLGERRTPEFMSLVSNVLRSILARGEAGVAPIVKAFHSWGAQLPPDVAEVIVTCVTRDTINPREKLQVTNLLPAVVDWF
jgi:hypothetical protein